MNKEFFVSFVHGFQDFNKPKSGTLRPALWKQGKEEKIFSYPFPRNPQDFRDAQYSIEGEGPSNSASDFEKKLPRFGLTGLEISRGKLYAGSWNGVYCIDQKTGEMESLKRWNP